MAVDIADGSDDEDVAREEDRVSRMDGVSGAAAGEEVVLRGLRKVFRTKQARLALRKDCKTKFYRALYYVYNIPVYVLCMVIDGMLQKYTGIHLHTV